MREEFLLNDGWLFHKGDINLPLPKSKGPIYTQSKTENMKWGPASLYYNDTPDDWRLDKEFCTDFWQEVSLPHDYIILQEPIKSENNALGYFHYENSWYRKHLHFDESDKNKRITIYFEGIATNATVYFNGCLLKHNFCGYTPFEIDITDYVRFGTDNVIAVYVNTESHEGWWYEGGGIYRNVWLNKTDFTAVDLYGVYVKPQKTADTAWNIQFETTLFNYDISGFDIKIESAVYDADSNCVCKGTCIGNINEKDKKTFTYHTQINSPVLWDIANPYLYTIITQIFKNGVVCDEYLTRTGFRTFKADCEKGFFLNGRHVKINGVCAHQDCAMLGKAVPDNVHRYKIELIKEMGANGYRTSHYPHSESTMDALDEMGFIVMNETRWYSSGTESCEQLEMLVKRDRNRPSVFFWSIGNEEPYHETSQGVRIASTLKNIVKKLDDTRIIMTAVSHNPKDAPVHAALDAIGINYNLQDYDILHKKYPHIPIIASECCATGTTRGWYYDDNPDYAFINAYDHDTDDQLLSRERTWKFLYERDYIMGGFQWIAFEHRGETVWPRLCSQSGAIDLFLQKKDAFYQNQSLWTDTPIIHMLPHWNKSSSEIGKSIKIWAYTNCDEAELILNKQVIEKKTVERLTHVEWTVPYTPGEIEVIGYKDGEPVARDSYKTSKEASQLVLKLDNKIIQANGRDIAIFTCYCVDEDGIFVPDATPFVQFHTNKYGRIAGTGSDITDHTSSALPMRKMRAGLITIAVKVGTEKGSLKLYAASENLKSTVIAVELS